MTWYDDNELKAYPLTAADNGGIPQDVLVDCIVYAPAALGTTLTIRSISVTALVVSVIFQINGVDVAYLTVPQSALQIHLATPLVALAPGVSGFVAFGNGVNFHQLRVDGTYPLLPECLTSYQFDSTNPTMTIGGHVLMGLVKLTAGPGLSITGATLRILREDSVIVTTPCAVIAVTDAALYTDPIPESVLPAEGNPGVPPIASVNGVSPDSSGNIALVVQNVLQDPTDPVITLVNTEFQDGGTPCGS